jgi:hypothetical protein
MLWDGLDATSINEKLKDTLCLGPWHLKLDLCGRVDEVIMLGLTTLITLATLSSAAWAARLQWQGLVFASQDGKKMSTCGTIGSD